MTRQFGQLSADKIHIQQVDVISATIENPLEIAEMQLEGFNFNLGFDMGFAPNDKMIKAELEVNLSTDIAHSVQATGKFKLAFLYHIENFSELVHLDDNGGEAEVSEELALAIASITYSTTRGILLARFQGTVFREFILPVISPIRILEPQLTTAE